MKKEDAPVVVEQTFDVSGERLWRAITQIDDMRQWYFEDIPAFEPDVGFSTQFNVTAGTRDFPHVWTVTESVPGKRIAYDWRYDGYVGDSFVVFELFEENGSTTLRLTHTVSESFSEDVPEFTRENGLAGWNYFIKESLKSYLDENG